MVGGLADEVLRKLKHLEDEVLIQAFWSIFEATFKFINVARWHAQTHVRIIY